MPNRGYGALVAAVISCVAAWGLAGYVSVAGPYFGVFHVLFVIFPGCAIVLLTGIVSLVLLVIAYRMPVAGRDLAPLALAAIALTVAGITVLVALVGRHGSGPPGGF